MFKDRAEKKSYRKSPGRQYGYAYNPLHEQGRVETSTTDTDKAWHDDDSERRPSRPGGSLFPRPDPRRTRQLLRQNILASKTRATLLEDSRASGLLDEEEADLERGTSRAYGRRSGEQPRGYRPVHSQEFEEEQIVADWLRHGESIPDPLDDELAETEDPLEERIRQAPRLPARTRPTRILTEEEEDELLAAELLERKRKDARRKFLLSALAIGGAGVAAYEILPRLPQAIGTGAANIEHQLQQAFQKGVTAGADAARKDLLNALDSLEGFSLEGAIEAAKLTRVAYDVFVSPLVTLAAEVADDFLLVTLNALIAGRHWLQQINEDTATLAALQTVLETWVKQVHDMPKKVQTITETDLDGAQAYLRALQREIQKEQAKLNEQETPTTTPATPHVTPSPKH